MSEGRREPLVAVVTPVHDGEAHLRRCMESVLRQSYENWLYIVVDNASTDRTVEIATEIAARDPRIQVLAETRFVGMAENFNRGLAAVPGDSVFVKQLHADDTLFPECLSRMVEAAERHPEAAMVIGRRYAGGALKPDGGPDALELLPGRTVARAVLLGGVNYLGTPSLPLLRRERMVNWPELFDIGAFPPNHPRRTAFCAGDRDAYLPTLAQCDVVFVPRALIDQRNEDGGSASSFAQRVGGWRPSHLELLLRHGASFLGERDYRRGVRTATLRYAASLAWRIGHGALGDGDFVLYQRLALAHVVARLRGAHWCGEAALLAPFSALLSRADPGPSPSERRLRPGEGA
jgi:glycosyltransferase involved in cell wall biosynthesis